MKPLVIVVALASAAHADSTFATDHAGRFVVSQLVGDTLTTPYEDSGVLDYSFSDAHTLWALRAQKGVFSIVKVVDGKPDKARVVTEADWKPPGNLGGKLPHLVVTDAGEVWLQRCFATPDAKTKRTPCPDLYLRIDAVADIVDHPPSGIRNTDLQTPDDAAAGGPRRVPGPKGYMFAVTTNGFTCSAPKHRLVFQGGTRWIDSAFWVTNDPAIAHFGVRKYDDFGTVGDGPPEGDGTGEFLLEDCTTYLVDVKIVEPGVVVTTEGKGAWKLRRGAKLLGTFTAGHVEVAPVITAATK